MNINDIRKLVEMISTHDLTDFELKESDFSIRIRRGSHKVQTVAPLPVAAPSVLPIPSTHVPVEQVAQPAGLEAGVELIKSPMVGTFYKAPSPDSKPFVSEGDKVSAETVVCIIEAMKVMNEIQSEKVGTILEVLVADGDPVEYGQPLFKIKKA